MQENFIFFSFQNENCCLSKEEFDSLPPNLVLREVHYYICIPGYRTKQVTLITTLLDVQLYPTLELVKIYELRWDVELDLKHIKTTLGMDILRGKTPAMVRKEIYVHLLAYNTKSGSHTPLICIA